MVSREKNNKLEIGCKYITKDGTVVEIHDHDGEEVYYGNAFIYGESRLASWMRWNKTGICLDTPEDCLDIPQIILDPTGDQPMTNKPELLPCPFCGCKDVGVVIAQKGDPLRSQVLCQGCGARGGLTLTAKTPSGSHHDTKSCIEAWNTRVTNKHGGI